MSFRTIRWILKKQIETKVNLLWTWDKKNKNFTCIYKNYNNALSIYTPQQLLDIIDEEVKPEESSKET
tara:strand:+ start:1387 stop:1590 length:204 start_codon:yes stop_codon:yes gene_type:complete